ncbi:MAG: nucleotide exchange factor GrpE [bacterium]
MIEGEVEVSAEEQRESLPSAPDVQAEAEPNSIREINDGFGVLVSEIQALNELARAREQSITRLHDEVQQLRRGELMQAIAPLVRDLISLHDQLAGEIKERETAGDGDGVTTFSYFCNEVVEILARYDVERFSSAEGDKFNPTEQRAVLSVPVEDAALDYRIAVMRRPGFRSGAKIVRYADVEVYRLANQRSRTDSNS